MSIAVGVTTHRCRIALHCIERFGIQTNPNILLRVVVFALVSAISRALVVLLLQAMPSPQRQVRIWCIVASKELRMDQLDVVIKTACIALPAWGPVFPCFFPVFCGSGWVVGAGCFVWGLFQKKK